MYEQSVEYHKRYMVAPRVISELSGTARKVITGKPADWVSYNGGIRELLNTLRASLGKPQVSEVADFLNKYFRGSRRKTGEAMGDYIIRKTEAYLRAQQALRRVIPHQRKDWRPSIPTGHSRRSSWDSATTETVTESAETPTEEVRTDETTQATQATMDWSWHQWQGSSWNSWNSGYGSWSSPWSWTTTSADRGYSYGPEPSQLEEILPDFVQGWFLLNDAGLGPSERNMIHTAVQGDYGVQRIAQELRNQWDESNLRRREGAGRSQTSYIGEDDGEWDGENLESEMGFDVEELTAEGQALVSEAEDMAQEALAAIEKGRRTLKDARMKQHQVRMARQYHKLPASSSTRPSTTWSSNTRSGGAGGTPDDSRMTCLKCGKVGHRAANCPQPWSRTRMWRRVPPSYVSEMAPRPPMGRRTPMRLPRPPPSPASARRRSPSRTRNSS